MYSIIDFFYLSSINWKNLPHFERRIRKSTLINKQAKGESSAVNAWTETKNLPYFMVLSLVFLVLFLKHFINYLL